MLHTDHNQVKSSSVLLFIPRAESIRQLLNLPLPFSFMPQLVQALLFTISLILYGVLFYAMAITPRVTSAPADTCFVTRSESQRLFPAVFCASRVGCCKKQNGAVSNVFINYSYEFKAYVDYLFLTYTGFARAMTSKAIRIISCPHMGHFHCFLMSSLLSMKYLNKWDPSLFFFHLQGLVSRLNGASPRCFKTNFIEDTTLTPEVHCTCGFDLRGISTLQNLVE